MSWHGPMYFPLYSFGAIENHHNRTDSLRVATSNDQSRTTITFNADTVPLFRPEALKVSNTSTDGEEFEAVIFGIDSESLFETHRQFPVELVLLVETKHTKRLHIMYFLVIRWLNGIAERLGVGYAVAGVWNGWNAASKEIVLG